MSQRGLNRLSDFNHRVLVAALAVVTIVAANCNAMPDQDEDIRVLELRNYLLKPNTSEGFRKLFNEQFVQPMHVLGGHTVGQFRIDSVEDHFVWMRGYKDMQVRLKFLNDFYLGDGKLSETGSSIKQSTLAKEKAVVVVDFYVCNGQLQDGIDLIKGRYLPFMNSIGVSDITLWISEMSENEFPRLPAFQDKNLLVTISVYKDKGDYESKIKKADAPEADLKNRMLEVITTRSRLVLFSTPTK